MSTYTPEQCIEAAFRFLLDREPQESILQSFDITVISRYFSEFERELPRYLSQSCGQSLKRYKWKKLHRAARKTSRII